MPNKGDTKPVVIVDDHVFESKVTAARLCPEKTMVEGEAIYENDRWYVPVPIIEPSLDDIEAEKKADKKKAALSKAKSLGLTDEEIDSLRE